MNRRIARGLRRSLPAGLLLLAGLVCATVLHPAPGRCQGQSCINSRGERVGEGARDGSFVCRAGTWVYSP